MATQVKASETAARLAYLEAVTALEALADRSRAGKRLSDAERREATLAVGAAALDFLQCVRRNGARARS